MHMGIGDWGLGFGDWGMGPTPKPQIPNPQSPIPNPLELYSILNNRKKIFNIFELKKI